MIAGMVMPSSDHSGLRQGGVCLPKFGVLGVITPEEFHEMPPIIFMLIEYLEPHPVNFDAIDASIP